MTDDIEKLILHIKQTVKTITCDVDGLLRYVRHCGIEKFAHNTMDVFLICDATIQQHIISNTTKDVLILRDTNDMTEIWFGINVDKRKKIRFIILNAKCQTMETLRGICPDLLIMQDKYLETIDPYFLIIIPLVEMDSTGIVLWKREAGRSETSI